MADVFISYKREERHAVERLAQELRGLGLDVWFDASLNAGEAFSDEIDREAHAAKAILVCWSPTARESQWVKSEALIGFEQRKLAACYVAGPDGFYPPTPFNSIHADDLRAWVGAPASTHAGYKSVLRRIGALCGRADIESYGALDVQAPASVLRSWVQRHESSPLFMAVDELLRVRDAEEVERARLEREARERRARGEAERRAREESERQAQEDQERRQRAEREERAHPDRDYSGSDSAIPRMVQAARDQAARDLEARRARRTPWAWIIGGGLVVAFVVGIMLNAGQEQSPPASALPEMVRIPGQNFEVSRTEVTFAQWDACVAAGGCNGYRMDSILGVHPVINVSWDDAQAYVRWLSGRTGQRFRLLTSAEWEIAARAGTTTEYSWGNEPPVCDQNARNGANFGFCRSYGTLRVGSFQPNGFGLYDMHGNVWEWVEDCYDSSCSSRVLRGGSWFSGSENLRSAYRGSNNPGLRDDGSGFRVARTL